MTKDEMTADNPNGTYTREFQDATGGSWLAVGVDDIVAHGKMGVRLAFRPMEWIGRSVALALRNVVVLREIES